MCMVISLIPIVIIWGIEGFKSTSIVLIALIIVITLAVSSVISYFVSRPIKNLTNDIDKISKGELDTNLQGSEIYEINNLSESLDRIMASLKLAIVKVGVKKDEVFEGESATKPFIKNQKNFWSEKNIDYSFVFDENAKVVDCTKNMYKKLGYSKKEILSLNIYDFDALESKEDIDKKIDKVKDEGSIYFKTIHKKKDGSPLLVYENMVFLNEQNKFKCRVREDTYK